MKLRRWLAVAMLAALLAPLAAHAVPIHGNFVITSGAATDTTAVGMADSSSFFFTAPYERLYLTLKPNKPCRLAIQVRTSQDTLAPSGAVALTDTTKFSSWYWRAYNGVAGVLNNQADSTVWKEVTAPTSVLAGEDEMVIEFGDFDATSNLKWWGVRAKTIELAKLDNGAWYWGEYTSVRYRVLTAPSSPVIVKATLKGVAF